MREEKAVFRRTRGRRPVRRLAVAALVAVLGLFVPPPASASTSPRTAVTTSITVDGTKPGRVFDGIGAISGGGGNSRLLIDYPEPQRSQILDYLFKPGYGASLQVLKLEIGGDANSTDGSEPSVEHSKGVVNCDAGYEFWLAEQAKVRNPNIELYGLAWTAPGWIDGGSGNFWSQDTIDYLMTWLGCAKTHHLKIDFLGGWNERGHQAAWYENLHATLRAKGYATKVVGDDTDWSTADTMVTDPAFAAAVDVVGAHYPCSGGDGGDALTCPSTPNALATGKPLWAGENGSQDIHSGAAPQIRSIVRGYLDGRITATLNWPVLAAITPNLPYPTVGLAVAPEPWSGFYRVGTETWGTAQVTQFTQPGWRFIDSASGYLGGARANGGYITLHSGADYSTIIETTTATSAQTANVTVTGGLSTAAVHVWSTDLSSSDPTRQFVRDADITPAGGTYSITLQPNHIYTLTTTTGQGKGTATAPAHGPLTLPYSDDFSSYRVGSEARYLSDMQGSYEVQPCADGRTGTCLQQMAPVKPIEWQDDSDAFSVVGDVGWGNYTVSADVDLARPGTVELLGRANYQSRPQADQAGYWFRVSDTGAWSIVRSDTTGVYTTLAHGTTASLGTGRWHHLAFTLQGPSLSAAVDGTTVGSVQDRTWTNGQAGLGVVGYAADQFSDLTITPGSGSSAPAGPITSALPGKCVDDNAGSAVNGTSVQMWDCSGSAAQQWTYTNQTLNTNGTCMDVTGHGTANGTLVEVWDCNGGNNQKWAPQPNGSLVSAESGKCLDDPGFSTVNGTQLEIWDCNGGANQKWTLP
ncbi:galactosylceramidase [Streptomyces yokosukanensis]|uniref:galactosylceramidase n=1 Tax=Streptomyces yokosukanensis TaxID=67386 RepID=A0A124HH83_9ACTN|nr:galactosylceramidase [Streptomyces yokosukanensis]